MERRTANNRKNGRGAAGRLLAAAQCAAGILFAAWSAFMAARLAAAGGHPAAAVMFIVLALLGCALALLSWREAKDGEGGAP